MSEGKTLTPMECIEFLADELQAETIKSMTFRDICLQLIDLIANEAVANKRKEIKEKIKIISMPGNGSGAVN